MLQTLIIVFCVVASGAICMKFNIFLHNFRQSPSSFHAREGRRKKSRIEHERHIKVCASSATNLQFMYRAQDKAYKSLALDIMYEIIYYDDTD